MTPEQAVFLEKLYYLNFNKLNLYAEARLQKSFQTHNVVQATFHEAVRSISKLMELPNPSGWLMATLKDKIQAQECARTRYIARFFFFVPNLEKMLLASDDTQIETAGPELSDALQTIKAALTQDEYQLFHRIVFDKASYLDISQELGITIWAGLKRLDRIGEKLRKADWHVACGAKKV